MRAIALAAAALTLLATPAFARERGDWGDLEHHGPFQIDTDEFRIFELGAMRGGRLGVQVSSMTEELRAAMGAPKDEGILVNRVLDDSAAKEAGVEVGDVLVEVAGEPISRVSDVWKALAGKEGDVAVEVIREKRRRTLTAKIEKPDRTVSLFPQNAELRREVEDLREKVRDLEQRLEKLEE